jgi:outer membrane protein insertion porin family
VTNRNFIIYYLISIGTIKPIMKLIFCLTALIIMAYSAGLSHPLDDQTLNRWLKKKPVIDSITVVGNKTFSKSKIKNLMFSRKGSILRTIKSDRRRRVQRETMLRDTSEVKYLYLSTGFLGVKLKEDFIPIKNDSVALVRMAVEEGRRFYYGKVDIVGSFEARFKRELNDVLSRFHESAPVNFFALKQAVYDCKSVLANNGYPYAIADFTIDTFPDNNRTDVVYTVVADSLVHFGQLHITGAENFDTALVSREMTFRAGDIYRRKDIIESQKHILGTGNYLTLQLYSSTQDSAHAVNRLNPDFILNLKEKKPRYLSIKTGAGQNPYKDLIWSNSIAWGKRNIFRSRKIELSINTEFVVFTEWRLLLHNYQLKLTEPWFVGFRMPLTAIAQIEPGVRSVVQPYRIQSWSISLETTKELKEKFTNTTGLEYKSVNIYGLSLADQEKLRQEKGIFIRQKLYNTIIRDSRDHPFMPRRGSLVSMQLEYAGGFLGGDESFFLSETSWSRYQKIWPGWISATRLKFGYVTSFGRSKEVPVDVRFYAGGANTVRSFSENELGPRSADGTPEGANVLVIANQEFRYPIVGKLWGSIFTDIGNGFRDWTDVKLSSLTLAYGIGLQFISPAGPIRFDYARHVKTDLYDAGYRFHFTILYAF